MIPDKIKNILHSCRSVLAAALIALPLLTGCHDSADAPDDLPAKGDVAEKSNVTLDLSIGINNGGGSDTRAFPDDEDGKFENTANDYEIVHTLRVVIVRHGVDVEVKQEDGSMITMMNQDIVEHNRMVNVNPEYASGNSNLITSYYVLHDNLRFNLIGGEEKTIYLFANEEIVRDEQEFDFTKELQVGEVFPKERVENLLIQRTAGKAYIDNINPTPVNGVMKRDHNVPMSEAFNIKVPAPSGDGEDLYKQTLFMTRSLIKFSFSISFDKGDLLPEDWAAIQNVGMKLSGVKITNLANSSYYLPRGTEYEPFWKYYPEPKTENFFDLSNTNPENRDTDKRYITEFTVPEDPGASECTFMFEEPIKIVKEGTNGHSYASPAIYLPESKVTGEGDDVYYVSLIFDDETLNNQYKPVPLRGIKEIDGIEGKERELTTDIPRNTHVKVNMTINLKKHDLTATVTLFPYTGVWLNPEFGFIIPVEEVNISMRSNGTVAPVTDVALREGQSINLIGTVSPYNATNKGITWKSSKPEIATVSNIGMVTAIQEGETEITATATDGSGKSAKCSVKVNPKILVESITLTPTTWTGDIGTTVRLTPTIVPAEATIKDLEWTSSNELVAIVSDYGIVEALSEGSAEIKATATDGSGKSATCIVNVNPKIQVTGITINQGNQTTYEGGEVFFTATVTPSNATDKGITWTSNNNDVATVTSYGMVEALSLSPGVDEVNVTITATSVSNPSITASRTVTVKRKTPVTGISINRTTWSTNINATVQLTATIAPSNATYKGVIWRTSNPDVASLSSTYANPVTVTAKGKGTAVITAYSFDNEEIYTTCTVTVN